MPQNPTQAQLKDLSRQVEHAGIPNNLGACQLSILALLKHKEQLESTLEVGQLLVDALEERKHDLLKKYVQHVYDEEGTTFIWSILANCSHSNAQFTEKEVKLLERLDKEVIGE